MNKILCCIPARYQSTRLPGKPLLKINKKTIINLVYEKALKTKVDKVIVLTDDERIYDEVLSFGGNCFISDKYCLNGTERIVYYLNEINHNDYNIIVNIQGDEPFIDSNAVNKTIDNFIEKKPECSTICFKTTDKEEILSKSRGKVVVDNFNNIIYCSRNVIPSNKKENIISGHKYNIHVGIFVFNKNYLLKNFIKKNTRNQLLEDIEWLKIIEQGFKVNTIFSEKMERGVDTIEDYYYLLKKYNSEINYQQSYRIGNILMGGKQKPLPNSEPSSWNNVPVYFPESICHNYIKKLEWVNKGHPPNEEKFINNIEILSQCISDKLKTEKIDLPKNNECIVHLRTGDIINRDKLKINELEKIYNEDIIYFSSIGNRLIPNKFYYLKKIKKLKTLNINNITIVTFFHNQKKENSLKSIKYVKLVYNTFKEHDFNIKIRILNKYYNVDEVDNINNYNINEYIENDKEFIYMTQSKNFIPDPQLHFSVNKSEVRKGGSTFEPLLCELIKHNNNNII